MPEGKSGQQVVDSLQRQLELLGAVKTGNFSVDCETYQSNTPAGNSSSCALLFSIFSSLMIFCLKMIDVNS